MNAYVRVREPALESARITLTVFLFEGHKLGVIGPLRKFKNVEAAQDPGGGSLDALKPIETFKTKLPATGIKMGRLQAMNRLAG